MRSDKLAAQVRSTVRACVRVSAAALLVSAALAGGFVAHAQEATTVVEGRVVNASSDGGSVGGLVVTLHEVTTEGRQELEAMTEPDGRFSFDEVLFDSESAYGVSVIYQDAFYGMDLDISKWPPDPVELTVYESSSDDGALAVSSASVLFAGASPETGTISAMEIVNLVNSGDQTYVPGPGRDGPAAVRTTVGRQRSSGSRRHSWGRPISRSTGGSPSWQACHRAHTR